MVTERMLSQKHALSCRIYVILEFINIKKKNLTLTNIILKFYDEAYKRKE